MIGIMSVPAITATLLAITVVLFSQDSAVIRELMQQRIWINEEVIPRLDSGDFERLVPPDGALVVVLGPEERRRVLFSSLSHIPEGLRVDEIEIPPPFSTPPRDDFSFFIQNVENASGQRFQIAQAFPVTLQRELFARARAGLVVLAIFIGMVLVGAVVGNFAIASFQRKLASIREGIRRIAGGDLEAVVAVPGNDELSELARDLESTRRQLKEEGAKRSRFLMSVSHDLKTPLTGICGYLEAIDDGLAGDEATLARYHSIIREKVELLEARILELIDFVRMETGDFRMQNSRIPLRTFLENGSVLFAEDARVHGRQFERLLNISSDLSVTGDRNLLLRVFENLFHNALRYTRENEHIVLMAESDSDDSVHIFVDDTGPGFGDTDPEQLFEPLARGNPSRQEPGFGLGLSTARAIVESHGWTIDARNRPGGGASFRIVIPNEVIGR